MVWFCFLILWFTPLSNVYSCFDLVVSRQLFSHYDNLRSIFHWRWNVLQWRYPFVCMKHYFVCHKTFFGNAITMQLYNNNKLLVLVKQCSSFIFLLVLIMDKRLRTPPPEFFVTWDSMHFVFLLFLVYASILIALTFFVFLELFWTKDAFRGST